MEKEKTGRNKSGQFTKGNNFAEGKGSPGKYKKEYANKLIEYFTVPPATTIWERKYYTNGQVKEERPIIVAGKYPTFEGFAVSIGVTSRTLENWRNNYPSFAEAYERAIDMQKDILIVNSLGGQYNGNFAKFVASSQFDMAEKEKHEFSGDSWEVNVNVKTADQS